MSSYTDSEEELGDIKIGVPLIPSETKGKIASTWLLKETTQLYYISILLGYAIFVCLFFYGSISHLPQLFGFYMNEYFWIKTGMEFIFVVAFVFFIHFKGLNMMKEGKVNLLSGAVQVVFYIIIILQVVFNIIYVVWISIETDKSWKKVGSPMGTKTARVFQIIDICMVGVDILVKLVLVIVMFNYFKSLQILLTKMRKIQF